MRPPNQLPPLRVTSGLKCTGGHDPLALRCSDAGVVGTGPYPCSIPDKWARSHWGPLVTAAALTLSNILSSSSIFVLQLQEDQTETLSYAVPLQLMPEVPPTHQETTKATPCPILIP